MAEISEDEFIASHRECAVLLECMPYSHYLPSSPNDHLIVRFKTSCFSEKSILIDSRSGAGVEKR